MKTNKPLVVFVFSKQATMTSTKYGGFAKRLQKNGGLKDFEVLTVALERLVFIVGEDKSARVIDSVSGVDMADASFVYFKSWSKMLGEASALAHFLRGRGISFMDSRVLGVGDSKISTIFKMWENNIRVPETIYSRNQATLLEAISKYSSFKTEQFVLKDIFGAKGLNNHLVNHEEARSVVAKDEEITYIAQRFIPNDGDYRVGVYASQSAFVIHRRGSGDTHLNNTSAGGKASYMEVTDAPKQVRLIAEKAAKAAELEVAGVDVIVDKISKKPMILEVNQGSQIVTGAFTEQNMAAFSRAITSAVKHRYSKQRPQPISTIGRREIVSLPELHISYAVAKIDSGAYTSTLHAQNIRLEKNSDGDMQLVYDLLPTDRLKTVGNKPTTVRTSNYFTQRVRSSTGKLEERYSIKTKLVIDGKRINATLTLSDRSQMGYPLLIGRRVIRSRFIINVELNELKESGWLY